MSRAKGQSAPAGNVIEGKLADGSSRFAAVDRSARFVEAKLAERPFGALLSPFASEAEARAALKRAGAVLQ